MVTEHFRGRTPTEICRFYGVPRKTFYYWLNVWKSDPDNFARNVARTDNTPKTMPALTDAASTELIVKLRKKSRRGPKALRLMLKERGVVMSEAGIAKVLKREGLVRKRKRKIKKKYKKYTAFMREPGQLVQVDVAWLPKLFGKSHRQYVYQGIDLYSRMSFTAIYPECTPANTVDFLKRMFGFFPFAVRACQFDHGIEFTYDMFPEVKVPHPVETLLAERKVEYRLSPVATPRMNGCVERLHRTWREEVERWHRWKNPAAMHRDSRKWLRYYNEKRPHFGIDGLAPLEKLRSLKKYENVKPDYSKCYFTV